MEAFLAGVKVVVAHIVRIRVAAANEVIRVYFMIVLLFLIFYIIPASFIIIAFS